MLVTTAAYPTALSAVVGFGVLLLALTIGHLSVIPKRSSDRDAIAATPDES